MRFYEMEKLIQDHGDKWGCCVHYLGRQKLVPPRVGILAHTVTDGITLMGLGGTVRKPSQ